MKKTTSTISRGFTIVELLIVIVVIAILAAISVAAYTGIQQRGRDSQRLQDVRTIAKAIEMYYLDNDMFPTSSCTLGAGGCKINSAWSTTSDGSWSHLEAQLVPEYISSLPKDPLASTTTNPSLGLAGAEPGHNYDYVTTTAWCDGNTRQVYLLSYRLESQSQKREIIGNCTGTQPTNYSSSEYIVSKN